MHSHSSHSSLPLRRHRVRKVRRPVPLHAEELEQRLVPTLMYPIGLVVQTSGNHVAPKFSSGQSPSGFWPTQIRHAYGFDQLSLDGTGQTIAIVDAYGDPNLASDLATFDAQFNLPAPPSFTQENQLGGSATGVATDPTGGWEVEETLDVEWAHVIAPKANILLVEANSDNLTDLLAAVNSARNAPGVVAVSMSWGGGEFSGETSYDSYFTTPAGHVGVTFLAASGDDGPPPSWPAVSANVVSVGGTTLALNSSDNRTSEIGWSGSGGGLSTEVPEPSYQTAYAGSSYVQTTLGNYALHNSTRGNPDVSFDADPSPGYALYDSFAYNGETLGWTQVGGTSAASPQWAGLIALADQGRGSAGSLDGASQTLPGLYQLGSNAASYANDFNDITSGSDGYYAAQTGYDLVTGLGTPKANNLIPDLEKIGQTTTFNITPIDRQPHGRQRVQHHRHGGERLRPDAYQLHRHRPFHNIG